jgi:hypothetical protein
MGDKNTLFIIFGYVVFAIVVLAALILFGGCSGDDDDDDSDTCLTCMLTMECKASLGRGYACEKEAGDKTGCCVLVDDDCEDGEEELLLYEEDLQDIHDANPLLWQACKWDNACCLCESDRYCSDIYDERARCVQWCCEWPDMGPVVDVAL